MQSFVILLPCESADRGTYCRASYKIMHICQRFYNHIKLQNMYVVLMIAFYTINCNWNC